VPARSATLQSSPTHNAAKPFSCGGISSGTREALWHTVPRPANVLEVKGSINRLYSPSVAMPLPLHDQHCSMDKLPEPPSGRRQAPQHSSNIQMY